MRRKVLLFALQFIPVFIICLWLYPQVLPVYQRVVAGAANVGLQRFDPPLRMIITEDGGWRALVRNEAGEEESYFYRPGLYLNLTYIGLALLPALLLATPVPPTRRLQLLVVGMLLLLVMYMPIGFLLIWSVRCLARAPGNTVCVFSKTVVNIYGQLASVVLWGLLTWDVWLPGKGSTTGDD